MRFLKIFPIYILCFNCTIFAQEKNISEIAADSAFVELDSALATKNPDLPAAVSGTAAIPKTEAKLAIAVMELTANNVSDSEASALSDRLRIEIFRAGVYQVMEREQMTRILDEMQFQLSGCTSNECAVEVGRLVGVKKMIAGSVGKVGEFFTVSVRLIDVSTSRIEKTATEDIEGTLGTVLTQAIPSVAYQISGLKKPVFEEKSKPEIKKTFLDIVTTPPQATIFIDQSHAGLAPQKISVLPGSHIVRITKEGYDVWEKNYLVAKDSTVKVSVVLSPTQVVVRKTAMSISSDPVGAAIYVNNIYKGTTPREIEVPPNVAQVLRLVRSGNNTYEKIYTLTDGQNLDLAIVLSKVQPQTPLAARSTVPSTATNSEKKGFHVRYGKTQYQESLNRRIQEINQQLLYSEILFKEEIQDRYLQFPDMDSFNGIEISNVRQLGDLFSLDFGLGFYRNEFDDWISNLFDEKKDSDADYKLVTWSPQIGLNLRLSPFHLLFVYPFVDAGAGYNLLFMSAYEDKKSIGGPVYHSYRLHYGGGVELRFFKAIGFAIDYRKEVTEMKLMDLGEVTDRFESLELETIDLSGSNLGFSLYLYY